MNSAAARAAWLAYGLLGCAWAQDQAAPPTAESQVPAAEEDVPQLLKQEQTANAGVRLSEQLNTLQAALGKVWRDNPEVVQAERALEASGYDLTTARAGYLPYAQVQSSQARNRGDSATTLYVVLPVWSGGLTNAQVDIAKAKQRQAMAQLAATRLDVGQRTLEAYFAALQAQDQRTQWLNYAAALRQLLETIQRRAQQGLAPQADVETAISRLRQAEAGAASSRAALLTARAKLISLVLAVPGVLSWPEDELLLSDEEMRAAAGRIEQHPNHLLARAEIDTQRGTARSALASLWPSISLQYHRQLEGVVYDPTNDATLLVMQYQTGNGVQAALSYRAEKQRIVALQARLNAVNSQIAATIDVDRAQIAAFGLQLRSQYEAAQAATKLIDSYMRQFEAGRKSWLDVLNAQREANDLRLQSVSLRSNFLYANAKLSLDTMAWERFGVQIAKDSVVESNDE